jgi:small GTP-binding protein
MRTADLKGVIVGEAAVGKTALVQRISSGTFNPNLPATLGGSSVIVNVSGAGSVVKFALWDTAGAERYRTLVPMYLRNAQVALVVFSLADLDSFENLSFWHSQVTSAEPDCEIGLIGTKSDLVDARVIATERGEAKALELGAAFYSETSAVTGEGVDGLLEQFLQSPTLQEVVGGFRRRDTATVVDIATEPPATSWWSWLKSFPC